MKRTTGLIGLLAFACATVVALPTTASAAGDAPVMIKNVQTGLCLDGNNAGSVYTHGCDGGNPYQHWYRHEGSQGVMLQSSQTGLCLSGKGPGKDDLYATACNSSDVKQWWEMRNVRDNTYTLMNYQNRKAIDSNAKGYAYLHQYGGTGNAYQHWTM